MKLRDRLSVDVFRQKEAGSAVGAGLAPARADAAVIRTLREFELSLEQLALRFFEEARLRLARAGASRGRPAPPLLQILLWKRLRALKFQLTKGPASKPTERSGSETSRLRSRGVRDSPPPASTRRCSDVMEREVSVRLIFCGFCSRCPLLSYGVLRRHLTCNLDCLLWIQR